tara:strand:- start:12308 stop:12718 length:411 start_codon:yes stop_codon:yes gene_type:complete
MEYSFTAQGHKNLLGTHKKTLEFTKEDSLTSNGDCIIGVSADFELDKLKEIVSKGGEIKIEMVLENKDKAVFSDSLMCTVNKSFNHETELVVRKSNMETDRTLGILADKGAFDINREMINELKNPEQKIIVKISSE